MSEISPGMRAALRRVVCREDLSREEIAAVFREIMAGRCDPIQVGALLFGLAQKGETMEEITGAAQAMREAVTVVPTRRTSLLDTCGTGGSGIARRNVSTAVGLAVAACGQGVAKHGNRAATSRSGSADVLEALGVNIEASPAQVGRCIDEVGVGFLFAAKLHPAMQHAAVPRRALGIRTVFNVLGPLTNPAGARRQLLGVFDPRLCVPLAGALGALGSERVLVVHGFRAGQEASPVSTPGIDDLSPEGPSWVAQWYRGALTTFELEPEMAGLPRVSLDALAGGDPSQNAAALQRLLQGERGPYRTAVQYSGAAALLAAREGDPRDLPAYAEEIGAVLDDGRAATTLARLVTTSHDGPER